MKSISVQYQELQEGKMTRHQFLRNARMMFPNHVTQHNSFEDSVKILKNRGLLNEGNAVKGVPDKAPSYDYPTQPGKYMKVVQEPEVDEQDGIYPATTLTDIPKEEVSKKVGDKSDGLEPIKLKDTKNEMKKIRIVKESKKNLTENKVTAKQIQDKYNEMFGKNPQTTFTDVAKALGVSEPEIAIALFSPDLAKNLREEDEKDLATPDVEAIKKMMLQNSNLVSKLKAVNSTTELQDLADEIFKRLDPKLLQNISGAKTAITNALKSASEDAKGKQTFRPGLDLGKSSEKFLSQFRSPGASGPEGSLNKLKEAIKEMVRKMVKEYEVGDESDEAPSAKSAVDQIADMMVDRLEDETSFKLSDLEDVFSSFESQMGKRYEEDVFNDVLDKLKEKGYNLK
jgi:hypothetical protein